MTTKPLLIAVMGPTGTGKSDLAERLTDQTGARLLNADAFQVYQGLDIGTNKPAPEDRKRYGLLDLVPPTHDFGVGEWVKRALAELDAAYQNRQSVIVVGGTGFYIRALFEEYDDLLPPPPPGLRENLENRPLPELLDLLAQKDPAAHARIDRQNPVRVIRALEKILAEQKPIKIQLPPFKKRKFGLQTNDDELKSALGQRLEKMLERGWVEEVRKIIASGIPISAPGLRAIGYQQLFEFCEGNSTLEEVKADIVVQTWQYARRQKTWLRSEPGLTPVQVQPIAPKGLESAFQTLMEKTLEDLGKK